MVRTASSGRGLAMVIRRSLLLLLLLLTSAALSFTLESTRLGSTDGSITIKWESLDTSYRVQVRRDAQIFIDTEQSDNELKLNLAPGSYEYRIHVLNPFGKDVSVSAWLPLEVESSRTPYFRVQNPLVIWEGETSVSMSVDSPRIRAGTVFMLSNEVRSIPAEWQKEGILYNVSFQDPYMEPGSWNLTATDPSGLTFIHPQALIVRPTRSPEVKNVSSRELPPHGIVPITLEGLAFDPEMTVEFEGPGGKLPVAAVEVTDGNKALVYLDLEDAQPGDYSLIVTNPSGEESRIEDTLTITPPLTEDIILEHPRFEFQIGYAPSWLFTPDNQTLPVYLGFEFAALFQSGSEKKFIRGLGIEFRVFGGMSGPVDFNNIVVNGIGSLDISGYYRPLVKGKIAPVIILGIGNMWSGYADQYGIHNILFIRTGVGMDIVNERRLTRIGLNVSFGAAGEDLFPMVSLMFRRGRRY